MGDRHTLKHKVTMGHLAPITDSSPARSSRADLSTSNVKKLTAKGSNARLAHSRPASPTKSTLSVANASSRPRAKTASSRTSADKTRNPSVLRNDDKEKTLSVPARPRSPDKPRSPTAGSLRTLMSSPTPKPSFTTSVNRNLSPSPSPAPATSSLRNSSSELPTRILRSTSPSRSPPRERSRSRSRPRTAGVFPPQTYSSLAISTSSSTSTSSSAMGVGSGRGGGTRQANVGGSARISATTTVLRAPSPVRPPSRSRPINVARTELGPGRKDSVNHDDDKVYSTPPSPTANAQPFKVRAKVSSMAKNVNDTTTAVRPTTQVRARVLSISSNISGTPNANGNSNSKSATSPPPVAYPITTATPAANPHRYSTLRYPTPSPSPLAASRSATNLRSSPSYPFQQPRRPSGTGSALGLVAANDTGTGGVGTRSPKVTGSNATATVPPSNLRPDSTPSFSSPSLSPSHSYSFAHTHTPQTQSPLHSQHSYSHSPVSQSLLESDPEAEGDHETYTRLSSPPISAVSLSSRSSVSRSSVDHSLPHLSSQNLYRYGYGESGTSPDSAISNIHQHLQYSPNGINGRSRGYSNINGTENFVSATTSANAMMSWDGNESASPSVSASGSPTITNLKNTLDNLVKYTLERGRDGSISGESGVDGEYDNDEERKVKAEAKSNRKIADLEITNRSLLAINASLEKTKHRQAKEIRELKRKLRESRTLLPPRAYALQTAGDVEYDSALSESDTVSEYDEELDEPNPQSSQSRAELNSHSSAQFLQSLANKTRDEERERREKEKEKRRRKQLDREAEKLEETYRRINVMVEILLETGKQALEKTKEECMDSKGGTKVLTAEEVNDWRRSEGGEGEGEDAETTTIDERSVMDVETDHENENEDGYKEVVVPRETPRMPSTTKRIKYIGSGLGIELPISPPPILVTEPV